AYFADRGEAEQRDTIVTADTAHGTNPASVTMAGYKLAKVRTDPRGNVDVAHLRELVSERTAGLMLTNPSTLGLFDEHIEEIAEIFHDVGALLYYDGANLNAVCGISRPGDMGFDIVHINLHKTFSQPHGGRGRRHARQRTMRAPQGGVRPPVRPSRDARVRVQCPLAEARGRHLCTRRREATDGLRLPSTDDLLPAGRSGGVDDRADGDRGQ